MIVKTDGSFAALVSGVNIDLDLNITLSDLTGLTTLPASVPRLTREAAKVTARQWRKLHSAEE